MSDDIQVPLHCTFEQADWQLLAKNWYPVAPSDDVASTPYKAMLLDEPLVLYRTQGALVVARDVCPHRGVPLTMGTGSSEGVVCPYHGLRFGVAGKCNRIPASPNQKIPEKMRLRTYPAVERYGLVWVCLNTGLTPADADIPVMPNWDLPDFQQILCPSVDIAAFAGRQMEGFLDVAHFGWVHLETFGDPENVEVPAYTSASTEKGFEAVYISDVSNYPIGVEADIAQGFLWKRHFEVHLPFTATLTVHFPDDGRLVIMNAASPVSAKMTRLFCPIAKNFDKHIPVEDIHAFNLKVFDEDRVLVEAQKPECLPLDPLLEVHIPADRSSIAYRRGLRDQGLSTFFLR
ncbi:vanillate O-demethylase monooxygenase subunit [Pseudomonas flavescens]|uniref:Vanillate O-demethylase monooxygenase subunit n=1 Tax=Phytopseudomonas flavescens TaxID=29435 RepID=A0A1G8J152_9GAMM|nr:aromatic ring-hydroxylating dioxygenase subunit alpha [Pseudomonas flavescens]SDI24772.1 vanillate O-demethylase monooxygenase subunit [Pseudomonas flavescens]